MGTNEIVKILEDKFLDRFTKLMWADVCKAGRLALIIDEEEIKRKLSKEFEDVAKLILANRKVLAEGIIDYKGTEFMGTIGVDFIDVVMHKNNGRKIIILEEE